MLPTKRPSRFADVGDCLWMIAASIYLMKDKSNFFETTWRILSGADQPNYTLDSLEILWFVGAFAGVLKLGGIIQEEWGHGPFSSKRNQKQNG